MSAIIDALIPRQQFEVVLDRIGEILAVEFENQSLLGSYDLDDITIFKERTVPCQPAELPIVNVSVYTGDYSEETQYQSQGTYRYLIEVMTNADSEEPGSGNDGRGDRLSALKLMRILGIIRAIIMDPRYKTLGFAMPSIGHRGVENIYFMAAPHQDANTSRTGRLILMVKVPEVPASFVTPIEFSDNFTRVKLHDTQYGYSWVFVG